MPGLLWLSGLLPNGFQVDYVASTKPGITVRVRSDMHATPCPACARNTRAVLMQRDNQDETRATNRMRTLRGGNVGRA